MVLSVIVPVYNAERTLQRCLDSLVEQWNQEGLDYEIICVNDGSTDNSATILQRYQQVYPHLIHVVEQDNRGVAFARNKGLSIAKGELIAFCDADDYLKKGAYKYIYDNYWLEDLDILRFLPKTLDRYIDHSKVDNNVLNGSIRFEGNGFDLFGRGNWLSFVWCFFYKRTFLETHSIRFKDVKIVEDILFNLDVFIQNPKMRFVASPIYYYTVSDAQTTRIREKQFMRDAVSGYLKMFSLFEHYAKEKPEIASIMYSYKKIELIPCLSRTLSADYDKRDYLSFVGKLREYRIIPFSLLYKKNSSSIGQQCRNLLQKIIFCFIFSNYYCYKGSSLVVRIIFVPYVLPYLSRN